MRQLSAIFMVSAVLAACGGNSEFSAGGAIPIEQLPAELAQALCSAEQSCAPFFYSLAFQSSDCKAVLTEQLKDSIFSQVQVAVTANSVKYDADKARTCVSAVGAGACSVLDNNLPQVCTEALAGTVATGGDCDIDAQCSGESRCQVTAGACPGKCAPRASAGVACNADSDCARGLTCSAATSHCASPAALGEPCKGSSAAECAAGLLCVGDDEDKKTAGACQTAAATLTKNLGETCDLQHGLWCASGLSCVAEAITPVSNKCHAVAAAGGECGLGLPAECPAGQYCPLTLGDLVAGKLKANCLALPAQGEACAPAVSLARCAGNLVCDTTTAPLKPVCVTRHGLGESCTDNALCSSRQCRGKVCVPDSGCAK